VAGEGETIELPAGVHQKLGIQLEPVRNPAVSRTLELSGSLAPDTDYLIPMRSRFSGEVTEIGKVPESAWTPPGTQFRDVRNGDGVHEGDLLAVVWSKDLGEKKSELIDALLTFKLDEETLGRYEDLFRKGAIPERTVHEAAFKLKGDRNAVTRAESTLLSWRLTHEEVQAIYDEATRLAARKTVGERNRDNQQWRRWARVEVRAAFDATVLEKNVSVGAIVDTTTNLFMIGDLTHLSAWAYAYEEDVPALKALPPPVAWEIRLKAEPEAKPLRGTIGEIRPIIDPTIHAALVKGRVSNPSGRLVAGQFITATVLLPPGAGELEIPTRALIEDGAQSVVFVEVDGNKRRYALRHVTVLRRSRERVTVRTTSPTALPTAAGANGLALGAKVVTSGNLEMWAALKDLEDTRTAD
jgi:cobalt-zinc-cadmium efflux system membrane fusion protein